MHWPKTDNHLPPKLLRIRILCYIGLYSPCIAGPPKIIISSKKRKKRKEIKKRKTALMNKCKLESACHLNLKEDCPQFSAFLLFTQSRLW